MEERERRKRKRVQYFDPANPTSSCPTTRLRPRRGSRVLELEQVEPRPLPIVGLQLQQQQPPRRLTRAFVRTSFFRRPKSPSPDKPDSSSKSDGNASNDEMPQQQHDSHGSTQCSLRQDDDDTSVVVDYYCDDSPITTTIETERNNCAAFDKEELTLLQEVVFKVKRHGREASSSYHHQSSSSPPDKNKNSDSAFALKSRNHEPPVWSKGKRQNGKIKSAMHTSSSSTEDEEAWPVVRTETRKRLPQLQHFATPMLAIPIHEFLPPTAVAASSSSIISERIRAELKPPPKKAAKLKQWQQQARRQETTTKPVKITPLPLKKKAMAKTVPGPKSFISKDFRQPQKSPPVTDTSAILTTMEKKEEELLQIFGPFQAKRNAGDSTLSTTEKESEEESYCSFKSEDESDCSSDTKDESDCSSGTKDESASAYEIGDESASASETGDDSDYASETGDESDWAPAGTFSAAVIQSPAQKPREKNAPTTKFVTPLPKKETLARTCRRWKSCIPKELRKPKKSPSAIDTSVILSGEEKEELLQTRSSKVTRKAVDSSSRADKGNNEESASASETGDDSDYASETGDESDWASTGTFSTAVLNPPEKQQEPNAPTTKFITPLSKKETLAKMCRGRKSSIPKELQQQMKSSRVIDTSAFLGVEEKEDLLQKYKALDSTSITEKETEEEKDCAPVGTFSAGIFKPPQKRQGIKAPPKKKTLARTCRGRKSFIRKMLGQPKQSPTTTETSVVVRAEEQEALLGISTPTSKHELVDSTSAKATEDERDDASVGTFSVLSDACSIAFLPQDNSTKSLDLSPQRQTHTSIYDGTCLDFEGESSVSTVETSNVGRNKKMPLTARCFEEKECTRAHQPNTELGQDSICHDGQYLDGMIPTLVMVCEQQQHYPKHNGSTDASGGSCARAKGNSSGSMPSLLVGGLSSRKKAFVKPSRKKGKKRGKRGNRMIPTELRGK